MAAVAAEGLYDVDNEEGEVVAVHIDVGTHQLQKIVFTGLNYLGFVEGTLQELQFLVQLLQLLH